MSSPGTKKKFKSGVNLRNDKITNPMRPIKAGRTDLRDKATINRLNMYKDRPVCAVRSLLIFQFCGAHCEIIVLQKRDKDGRLISGFLMSTTPDEKAKRIQPDRRWFGTLSLSP